MDEQATELANRLTIVDTHIDVPYRVFLHYEDVSDTTLNGDFDFPRAVAGGLDVPFMAIYVPAESEASGTAFSLANLMIDSVQQLVVRAPEKFALASTVSAAENAKAQGKIALAMGIENGSPIMWNLDNVRHFHARGIRYITLTHSKSNHIADSSYDESRPWQGLSPFGKKLVIEMNRIGIMIDISHSSDQAFVDVLEISQTPIIASHSSARHFTPGFERNMSDEMIIALAASGGVIQINFGSAFLTPDANLWRSTFNAARIAFRKEHDISDAEDPAVRAFEYQYREAYPYPYASLENVLDHIDHVVSLVGVDHVGIGSDFDGVGDTLPPLLKDVSGFPNLIKGLLGRDYDEQDIQKILSGNLFRVWREIEEYAAHY
jgi:membrane dipeptidase